MLLGFQLAGEFFARLAWLPISGPIDADLAKVSDGVLANMALLFVPVGVGAMRYAGLFAGAWRSTGWPEFSVSLQLNKPTMPRESPASRSSFVWDHYSFDAEARGVGAALFSASDSCGYIAACHEPCGACVCQG